jgi:hypothetical protein
MTRWFNNIRKAPPPYNHTKGNKYYWMQIEDIPGLKELFSLDKFPLHDKMWRKTQAKVHFRDDNKFNPSVRNYKDGVVLATILDLESGNPSFPWVMGRLKGTGLRADKLESTPFMMSLAGGDELYDMEPDEVGIEIIYRDAQGTKPLFILNIQVPKDNDFEQYANRLITTGTKDKDYDLSNGEVAALLILSQMAGGRADLRERKRLFDEFKVGPLVRGTDSKYIKALVDKGFFEMDENHASKNLKNYPLVTAKGNAASNRFEMTKIRFVGEFKREVLASPDDPFTAFEVSDDFSSQWE